MGEIPATLPMGIGGEDEPQKSSGEHQFKLDFDIIRKLQTDEVIPYVKRRASAYAAAMHNRYILVRNHPTLQRLNEKFSYFQRSTGQNAVICPVRL